MIETDGAVLRVSSSYAIKKPGSVPYSSEDAHYSFSVEQPLEDGISLDQLVAQAKDLAEQLELGVKLSVFSSLDVPFTDIDGTLRPVFDGGVPTAAPTAAPAPKAQGGPTSGNVPRADRTGDPKVTADFGKGQAQYLDNRPKKASGAFKPGAADFRSVEKIGATKDGAPAYHSVWITSQGGGINQATVDAMAAAGIE